MTLRLSKNLNLPDSIGTETIAVLGRRGSGKSNTGTVLIEELARVEQQFVLIDPKGEGWGLKAQGKGGAGLDVIVFGEPEGDLPLREEHGETIADFVVSSGRSCVLSLAGLESDAAIRRLVSRFADRLYTEKRKPENHGPLMVVLEEAHLFVPQRVEGAQAEMVGRLQRLVRQGRSMGIGVTLIDQRPASVNKDVLTQIELMVCHQLTSPHDRKAVDAWIEANADGDQAAEFRRTLPTLAPGEAWVWSPAKLKVFERAKIRERRTFDSGATPTLGKVDAAARPKMRQVDLDGLRAQLDQVVQERKANDPAELKKTIVELRKQLAEKPATAPAERVEVPVISPAVLADLEKVIVATGDWSRMLLDVDGLLERKLSAVRALRDELVAASNEMGKAINRVTSPQAFARDIGPRGGLNAAKPAAFRPAPRNAPEKPAILADESAAASLSAAQRRLIAAAAWWEAIGVDVPSRPQLAFVARIKPTGGHFSNSIGPLVTGGLFENVAGGVRLTGAGRRAAPAIESRPTLAAYHDGIREVLATGAQRTLFDAIVARRGAEVSAEELGQATGINPTGGHFSNSIGPLSTLGLIERRQGVVLPTDLMFPKSLTK